MSKLRSYVKRAIEMTTGYTVQKYPPDYVRWLFTQNIQTIIDIGANEGEFAKEFRRYFPHAHIHSFEPLPTVFAQLRDNFRSDKHVTVHNYALGNMNGETTIFRNDFSQSSSLLPMGDKHVKAFPHTAIQHKERIQIKRLDDIYNSLLARPNVLVKIDVQGFESDVIEGATNSLRNVFAIIIEMSYVELYQGQKLADDLRERLNSNGFIHVGDTGYIIDNSGKRMQGDGFFVREEAY